MVERERPLSPRYIGVIKSVLGQENPDLRIFVQLFCALFVPLLFLSFPW